MEWEKVLKAAADLQGIVPGAVLVGGTAAAVYAGHRISLDADHMVEDLGDRRGLQVVSVSTDRRSGTDKGK